jgi:hypothetical protein
MGDDSEVGISPLGYFFGNLDIELLVGHNRQFSIFRFSPVGM